MNMQKYSMPFIPVLRFSTGMKFIPSTRDHVEGFQNVIKYLVKLRRDGDIDDETFNGLVKQAAAAFVETEISDRVDRVLEDKLSIGNFMEFLP
jgi:hypothetical protein